MVLDYSKSNIFGGHLGLDFKWARYSSPHCNPHCIQIPTELRFNFRVIGSQQPITIGIRNLDTSGFWKGFEILKPNHLKSRQMTTILAKKFLKTLQKHLDFWIVWIKGDLNIKLPLYILGIWIENHSTIEQISVILIPNYSWGSNTKQVRYLDGPWSFHSRMAFDFWKVGHFVFGFRIPNYG